MKPEPTTSIQIAKIISVIGHPFVLLVLTILIAAARAGDLPEAVTTRIVSASKTNGCPTTEMIFAT